MSAAVIDKKSPRSSNCLPNDGLNVFYDCFSEGKIGETIIDEMPPNRRHARHA